MTAANARAVATATDANITLAPPQTAQPASIFTPEGRFVTGGIADIAGSGARWSATLRHLDRPGLVASLYFTGGLRDVVLRLRDGRRARARITATRFAASSQRVCELQGAEHIV